MPREFSRSQRMAEQVRRELAEIVRDELKDPRMGFTSFTEVRMSRDLSHAVIYCSVLNPEQRDETIELLNRAVGFFRKEIARRIRARIVPTLKFVLDDSITRGAAMDDLISEAIESDKKHSSELAGGDESEEEST
jgi:ribosome-binding factor A